MDRKDNKGRILHKGESQRKDTLAYIYQYHDIYGKQHTKYAKDLMTLREKENRLIRDKVDGIDLYTEGRMSLNTFIDKYMSMKYDLSLTTAAGYKFIYEHYIKDTFGTLRISKIKYSDVKEYYLSMIVDKGLSAMTVDNVNTLLHPVFELCVRDGIIRVNPAKGVMSEIKRSKLWKVNKRHALTLEQQRAFLDFVKHDVIYSHWYPLFAFMLGTGERISEVAGTVWEDIDFENDEIRVKRQLNYRDYYDGKGSVFKIAATKTEMGTRVIPMMTMVKDVLQEQYNMRRRDGGCDAVVDGVSNFVFYNRFGGPLYQGTVNQALKRIIKAYNTEEAEEAKKEKREALILPDFSCHYLRHTFCTRLCENTSDIKAIQAIMGHSDAQTTLNIYAEATKDSKNKAIHMLDNVNLF